MKSGDCCATPATFPFLTTFPSEKTNDFKRRRHVEEKGKRQMILKEADNKD